MILPRQNLLSLLLCAFFFILPAWAQDEKPVDLRPGWAVGQTARYDFWSEMQKEETAELFGQVRSEKTVYLSEGQTSWTVDEVNEDGSAACTMKMVKIKFTITAGEAEPMVFDSENLTGDEPMFDQLIIAMVNTPLTVRVNADGTIAAVEGIDELANAAGQEAQDADVVPEELDFKETASELATLIAAPASATPGQTWNAKNTWNQDNVLPGADATAAWDTTFTFASLGQIAGVPIATIDAESDIEIEVDLSELPEESPDIDIQISEAKGAGKIFFDLSRRETVARNDSMTYTAEVTVTPPNDEIPPIKIKIVEKSQSQLLRVAEE